MILLGYFQRAYLSKLLYWQVAYALCYAEMGTTSVDNNVQAAIRAEGCKAVAEACALSLERLLALGRSLASSLRYSRPADDGIRWPGDARAVTAMLRQQVSFTSLHGIAGARARACCCFCM